MTQEQLKELEDLNERWANECPTQRKMLDVALDIMDLLPDVIAHVKELERGIEGMHQSVQSMELTRKGLETHIAEITAQRNRWLNDSAFQKGLATAAQKERDACLAREKECTQLLQGQTNIVGQSSGEIIRKLVAERDAALKARAGMRDVAELIIWSNDHVHGFSERRQELVTLAKNAISTDCGKDFVPRSELDAANAKCAEMKHELGRLMGDACEFIGPSEDGEPECGCCHMSLESVSKGHRQDCLAKAIMDASHALSTDCGKGYRHDDEWKPVVEALRQVDQCGMEHFKFSSCACAGGVKQALAHAERITGGGK